MYTSFMVDRIATFPTHSYASITAQVGTQIIMHTQLVK